MVHRHSFCVYLDVDFADVAFKDVVVGADRRHYELIEQFFNLTKKIEIFSSFMTGWTVGFTEVEDKRQILKEWRDTGFPIGFT